MDEPKLQCPSRHRRVARLGLWFAVVLALASCQPNTTSATSTTQVPCAGCHTPDWQTTVLPNHQTKGFGTDCAKCHQTKAWRPAKGFDHALAFPLLGKHATVVCQACHTGAQLPAKTCAACHEPDYLATQAPNHVAIGISTDCGKCHTNDSWKPTAGFDHATVFPLLGKHTAAACAGCHVSDQPPPKSCAACHAAAYAATTKPNHAAVGLPTTCETCHSPVGWKPATGLNHDLVFPLLGKHATAACTGCHVSDAPPPKTCAACHAPAYAATTKPNHAAIGLSTTCEVCHTADAWLPASGFDHAKVFPLLGKHLPVACAQCHTSNQPPPKTCVGCHMAAFLATTQPNHQTTGLPTTCDACHTTADWKPAPGFDHAKVFPLLGKHVPVACTKCHTTNQPPPKTCAGCHVPAYLATTAPNHQALGIATACETCHTTADWKPAPGFDHAKVFALLGKHTVTPCTACHTTPSPPPKLCFACHQTTFLTAKNPDHVLLGFPTGCESCHSATAWQPAKMVNHTPFFPISSGKHANLACTKCHDNPASFKAYTCLSSGCHAQAATAKDHTEVLDYTYTSAKCYECHPKGVGD
jgi:hypothetical protein